MIANTGRRSQLFIIKLLAISKKFAILAEYEKRINSECVAGHSCMGGG